MAKLIPCPECSKGSNRYLMLVQSKREYDEELHMPITIYTCNICRLKMRVTGVICIDCGGRGEYTKVKETSYVYETSYDFCPHCNGWGIIPKKFEIIPGNKPKRIESAALYHGLNMDDFDMQEFMAVDNKYRGYPGKRGDPFGADW